MVEIPRTQEVYVFWGGYSSRTMLPSLLVCFGLTALIVWLAWTFFEREDIKLIVLSASGILWVVQSMRFGYRFFGYNYLATTRRLVQDWGLLNKGIRTLFLTDVERVDVRQSSLEKLL